MLEDLRMQAFWGGSIPRTSASDPSALPRWSGLRRTAEQGFEARLAPERRTAAPTRRERTVAEADSRPADRAREEPAARGADAPNPPVTDRPQSEPPPAKHDGHRSDAPVAAVTAGADTQANRGMANTTRAGDGTAGLAAVTPAAAGAEGAASSQPASLVLPSGTFAAAAGSSTTGTATAVNSQTATSSRTAATTTPTPNASTTPPSAARHAAEAARAPLPRSTSPALLAQAEAARDRIVQQVVLQTTPDGGRVKLSLTPPELGRLDVELVVEDGRHARLVLLADRPETAQVLERALPDLARSLADQGLVLDESRVGTRDPSPDRSERDGHDAWGAPPDDFTQPLGGLWRPDSPTRRGTGLDWIA